MTARPDNLDMRALLPPVEERRRLIAQWLAEDIGLQMDLFMIQFMS